MLIKTQADIIAEHKKYLDGKRDGTIIDLLTPWNSLNEELGGLEEGSVTLLCSPPGTGKTSIMIQMEEALPKINRGMPVEALIFSLEMLGRNIVSRKISKSLKMSTKYINQRYGEDRMSDKDYEAVQRKYAYYRNHNVVYVEDRITVAIFESIINRHRATLDKKHGKDNYILYVAADHTMLLAKEKGQNRLEMLEDLSGAVIGQKKKGRTILLILNQTNRNFDDRERLQNKKLQAPNKSDVFGGDAIVQASDVIIVIVNPYHMGLSHWECYGDGETSEGKIFWHIIKQREGDPLVILRMRNNLQVGEIADW